MHRRQRGRLARAGGPGDQDQPARPFGQLGDDRRQAEVLEGPHVEGNHPDDHRHAAALLEHVAAEPGQVLDAEREVELVLGLEALLLVFGEHRVGQRQGVLGRQDVGRGGVGDIAVDAKLGPLARGDMQVGRVLLDHFLEQCPQVHRHAAVSLMTSSSVVTPRSTFFIPSMRRVSMPSATA